MDTPPSKWEPTTSKTWDRNRTEGGWMCWWKCILSLLDRSLRNGLALILTVITKNISTLFILIGPNTLPSSTITSSEMYFVLSPHARTLPLPRTGAALSGLSREGRTEEGLYITASMAA